MADYFRKGKSLFSTTSNTFSTGDGVTITPNSVTGLPTDCEICLTFDRVDSGGTATPTKMERIIGVITGGNFVVRATTGRGADGTTDQAHTSPVVEYIPNAEDMNDQVDGLLVAHAQTGIHKSGATYAAPVFSGTATGTYTLAGTPTITSPTINTPTLTLTDSTGVTTDGGVVFDRTNEDLAVGDGSAAQKVHMGVWKSWVPTFGGFSADPTGGLYFYTVIGKTCICTIQQPNNGTSNATNFTITAPLTSVTRTNASWIGYGQGTDNTSTYMPSVIGALPSNSATITLATGGGATGWTNSGGKRVQSFFLIYEIA